MSNRDDNIYSLFSDKLDDSLARRKEAGQAVVRAAGQRSQSDWERQQERQAREFENERWAEGKRPSLFRPWSLLWFIEQAVNVLWKCFSFAPTTMVWLVLLLAGVPVWVATLFFFVGVGKLLAPRGWRYQLRYRWWGKALLNVSPLISDFYRLLWKRRDAKAKRWGEELAVTMGLCSEDELHLVDAYVEEFFDCGDEEILLCISLPFVGFDESRVEELVKRGLIATRRYVDAQLQYEGNSRWAIILFDKPRHDATEDVHKIDAPLKLVDVEKLTIPVGVSPVGELQTISLAGNSGLILSGLPGKGKTAGAITLLTPLLMSEFADVHLFDGKGGQDWSFCAGAAKFYSNDDVNLQAVLDYLKSMQEMMRERVKTQKELFGDSNFWNQKRDSSHRAQVIVIDEAQTFFETAGRPKDEKVIIEQIQAVVRDLIKKGRSAGFVTVLITQKPTSDAIPTSIRDVCGLRVSFYVSTPEMATSVLGVVPEGAPSPTQINPRNVGCSVMATESGDFERVKWFYLPEAAAEAAVQASVASRAGSASLALGEASGESDEL